MKTVLKVNGMKCGGCETTVQEAVKSCPGVLSVKANHRENTVEIELDENLADLETIRKTITDKGYQLS